jgi:hypothetical protein
MTTTPVTDMFLKAIESVTPTQVASVARAANPSQRNLARQSIT